MNPEDTIEALEGEIGDLKERIEALEGDNNDLRGELAKAKRALDDIGDTARFWETRR